eukprot:TRINITY_DN1395_c0_g1_i3.p1 TRINITY_DN1395_c0_g1~~TRINITY_DN1395_c0_g1_i3.p1  ORF type:complete len:350 (-),score=70.91 TRINITY_DN1395_c0_g1_i3:37-1086(-)
MIIQNLQSCRVECGYASVSDVDTYRLEDRMDSFFLTETCKYLYLLFDEHNKFNSGGYIFTTEGHLLPMKQPWQKSSKSKILSEAKCKVKSDVVFDIFTVDDEFKLCNIVDGPKQHISYKISGLTRDKIKHIQFNTVKREWESILEFTISNTKRIVYCQHGDIGPNIYDFGDKQSIEIHILDTLGCDLIEELITGKYVLVKRGVCTFSEKVKNLVDAGAIGVIVSNTNTDNIFSLSKNKEEYPYEIPVVMVSKSDGDWIRESILNQKVIGTSILAKNREEEANYFVQIFLSTKEDLSSENTFQGNTKSNVYINEDYILFVLPDNGTTYWAHSLINIELESPESYIDAWKI